MEIRYRGRVLVVFAVCLLVLVGAVALASLALSNHSMKQSRSLS